MKLRSALTLGAAAGALALAFPAQAGSYVSLFGGWSNSDSDFTVGPFSASTTKKTSDYSKVIHGAGFYTVHHFYRPTYTNTATVIAGIGYYHTLYYNSRQTIANVATLAGFRDEADSGFVVGGAWGLTFEGNLRAEFEAAYRSYDIGSHHQLGGMQSHHSRTYLTLSVVGYVFYDAPPIVCTGSGPCGTTATSSAFTSGDPFVLYGYKTGGTGPTTITGTAHSSGDLTAFSLMANVWYDFDLGTPVVPFIGAGIGTAKLDLSYDARVTFPSTTTSTHGDASDWVFAWQLGAGLGYELGNGMTLSAQYRYFATGDASVRDGQSVDVKANEVLIGLNIPLGN